MQYKVMSGIEGRGFTLVETLVGVAIFVIVAAAGYEAYTITVKSVERTRLQALASALANEQFEIARSLPYVEVGIIGGLPAGKIPHVQTLTRSGVVFSATSTVRNIDDPFDGVIGGNPNDTSPADYKLVEVEIGCAGCQNFTPLTFTTQVGPRNLENTANNGALFIRTFDSSGVPVAGADIHVVNSQTIPTIIINDTSDNNGMLQIVDTPPGIQAYEVTVSKPGYSTEQTYLIGAPGNPNPVKPHATVATAQVTQTSFIIDRLAAINFSTKTNTCQTVPNLNFSLQGVKLIGTNPNIPKYNANHNTGVSGALTLPSLEWDTYSLAVTGVEQMLTGSLPLLPLILSPASNVSLTLITAPVSLPALLVTVRDGATNLPLTDASVELTAPGYDEMFLTGRARLNQTDWSGGPGQTTWVNQTRYLSDDGSLATGAPAGAVTLLGSGGVYVASSTLISSTFDLGSVATFHQLFWQGDQPVGSGADSVRFQLATNNNQTTWDFVGPDGTPSSFYTADGAAINAAHQGDRYLRYKLFLQTANQTVTPRVDDVGFTFTADCVPPGQVIFSSLATGTYTLVVTKAGYQPYTTDITVGSTWQTVEVPLLI